MLDLRNQTLNDEATESKPKEQKKVFSYLFMYCLHIHVHVLKSMLNACKLLVKCIFMRKSIS